MSSIAEGIGDFAGGITGGLFGSNQAADAAAAASKTQAAMADKGIAEQQRQFNKLIELMSPYVTSATGTKGIEAGGFDSEAYLRQNPDVKAVLDTGIFNGKQVQDAWMTADDPAYAHWQQYGQKEGRAFPTTTTAIPGKTGSLDVQRDLLGLNGPEAQQLAIQSVSSSPEMAAMLQTGENAILQNASATGGLRGGNTQAALATFRPQLLSQLIQQRFSNLGGLTQLGQASAAGQASQGMNMASSIASLLGDKGAALAGGQIAQGGKTAAGINSLASTAGAFFGMGGIPGIKTGMGF